MQKLQWVRHKAKSHIVSNCGFGRSHEPQSGSLAKPMGTSPLVKIFIVLIHVIHRPSRTILQPLATSNRRVQRGGGSLGIRKTYPNHHN